MPRDPALGISAPPRGIGDRTEKPGFPDLRFLCRGDFPLLGLRKESPLPEVFRKIRSTWEGRPEVPFGGATGGSPTASGVCNGLVSFYVQFQPTVAVPGNGNLNGGPRSRM